MRAVGYVVAALGMLLLLAVLPFYLASGLMAPMWAVVVLLSVWVVLFVLAIKWFGRHPYRVLSLPFAAVAIWFPAMYAGDTFLGWTA